MLQIYEHHTHSAPSSPVRKNSHGLRSAQLSGLCALGQAGNAPHPHRFPISVGDVVCEFLVPETGRLCRVVRRARPVCTGLPVVASMRQSAIMAVRASVRHFHQRIRRNGYSSGNALSKTAWHAVLTLPLPKTLHSRSSRSRFIGCLSSRLYSVGGLPCNPAA